jgi:hypothetical protein
MDKKKCTGRLQLCEAFGEGRLKPSNKLAVVVRGHVSCSIFRARGAIPMNEIVLGHHLDKLIRRRGQIVMTLHYLAAEQKQVEQNTDWLDQAAYESKVNLLDGLKRLVCHGNWPDR